MHRIVSLIVLMTILSSCTNDKDDNSLSLSSLLEPNFTFNQDFFNCSLNTSSSLIKLESFMSNVVDEYKTNKLSELEVSLLFPDGKESIKDFIISIKSKEDRLSSLNLVNYLRDNGFENVASCGFSIYQKNALDIVSYIDVDIADLSYIEILRCEYNEGYNYGTFKISLDRFVNKMNLLKIPYSLTYIAETDKNNFMWINTFYDDNYEDSLVSSWINSKDALEIKEEFGINAACIDSKSYKSYKLL
mgnify:CR=1 FL=1